MCTMRLMQSSKKIWCSLSKMKIKGHMSFTKKKIKILNNLFQFKYPFCSKMIANLNLFSSILNLFKKERSGNPSINEFSELTYPTLQNMRCFFSNNHDNRNNSLQNFNIYSGIGTNMYL